jgi:hypothetical protein
MGAKWQKKRLYAWEFALFQLSPGNFRLGYPFFSAASDTQRISLSLRTNTHLLAKAG